MLKISLKAHSGARDDSVGLLPDGRLDVRVRAPALDGRANAAIVALVADALRLRPRQVRLLRGERARDKVIEIELPDHEELRRRLYRETGNGS